MAIQPLPGKLIKRDTNPYQHKKGKLVSKQLFLFSSFQFKFYCLLRGFYETFLGTTLMLLINLPITAL